MGGLRANKEKVKVKKEKERKVEKQQKGPEN